MQLKETPDLTQEFLDLSTSSSDDSAPAMTSLPPSSTSTTSPSTSAMPLRTSGVSTLTSSPSRATAIVSLPSSTSSSSTSSSYQQYSPVQSSLFPIQPSLTSQLSRFQCLRNTSSSSSSTSIVPSFPRLLSPQKSQFVLRGSVPSRNASKCLFGPSDAQQNKKDFDKLMRFTAIDVDRNVLSSKKVGEEGLCPGFPNVKRVLTPVEARAGAQTPTLKRRRTEGHLEFYFPRKKTATTLFALKECREVKDDESVWRSPKKFSNNSGQVRLIPKVTPLRGNANNPRVPEEHKVSGEFDLSTMTSPSGHLDRRHVRMEWERGISLDVEESMLTSQEQEMVPAARRVPVVQLRPAAQSRQRRRSHSDSNLKKSEADTERDGGLRRRSSSSQLCSSLEKIATFDHNNNSNSAQSEGFKMISAVSKRLSFQQHGSSSPCTVSSTNPELETFACLVCPSRKESTFPEMEARPNVSPDSSMEVARLPDDPYLRLIREREILGFVPIPDRFDSREETSESLED